MAIKKDLFQIALLNFFLSRFLGLPRIIPGGDLKQAMRAVALHLARRWGTLAKSDAITTLPPCCRVASPCQRIIVSLDCSASPFEGTRLIVCLLLSKQTLPTDLGRVPKLRWQYNTISCKSCQPPYFLA